MNESSVKRSVARRCVLVLYVDREVGVVCVKPRLGLAALDSCISAFHISRRGKNEVNERAKEEGTHHHNIDFMINTDCYGRHHSHARSPFASYIVNHKHTKVKPWLEDRQQTAGSSHPPAFERGMFAISQSLRTLVADLHILSEEQELDKVKGGPDRQEVANGKQGVQTVDLANGTKEPSV